MSIENQVKMVRLLSGEEIIAQVKYPTSDYVTLFSPLVIMPNGEQGGRMSFGFMPWPVFADKDDTKTNGVDVYNHAIVMIYNPVDDILNQYNTAMGKIIVPKKSALILG